MSGPTATAQYSLLDASFVDPNQGWPPVLADLACGSCPLAVRTTADGGLTWQPLPSLNVGPLDDQNPRSVRHLTFATDADGWAWGNGLFVTHDGGLTWVDETLPDRIVVELRSADSISWRLERSRACSPNSNSLVDCTWTLEVSKDNGHTWQLPAGQPPITSHTWTADLAIQGSNAAWIATSSRDPPEGSPGGEFLVTRDGGTSWQQRPFPCFNHANFSLAFSPSLDGQQLWVICGGQPATAQQEKHLFVSGDDGQHWSEPSTTLVWSGHIATLAVTFCCAVPS